MITGKSRSPVSALTLMVPLAPTLTVATEKTPVFDIFGCATTPSPVGVAARATISGTGVSEAESSSVFKPIVFVAGSVLLQSKMSCTSVGAKAVVGVSAKTKLCDLPAAMSTAVSAVPVMALVMGAVV